MSAPPPTPRTRRSNPPPGAFNHGPPIDTLLQPNAPARSPLKSRLTAAALWLPRRAWSVVRRHPWRTLLAALVLLAGAVVGVWRYAVHQWHAAEAALKQDRLDEARDRLAFCLRVWPRSTEVHLLAARAARLSGNLPEAEAHLNRCLSLEGGATDRIQLEFLLLRVQAGEVDDLAPALFDAVHKGHPDSPLILETIARSFIQHLRYKPAVDCLSLWISLQPENPKPYYWRGWSLERLNNPKAAKEDYERALAQDPEQFLPRLRVAEMLLEDKQAPEALPHLERLRRQAPDDPRVQARMGTCLFLQGSGEEARRLMEAALVHLPNDAPLLISLASLDLQENRPADAERRLRTVLAADPADTEALFILVSAVQLQGRAEESTALLAQYERQKALVDRINALLKDKADSPTATANDYSEIGRMFLQIGQDRLGVYWLERALELDSTHQPSHQALAAHYERKGNAAKASAYRRQIRDAAPNSISPGP